jgi:hypothetical protein
VSNHEQALHRVFDGLAVGSQLFVPADEFLVLEVGDVLGDRGDTVGLDGGGQFDGVFEGVVPGGEVLKLLSLPELSSEIDGVVGVSPSPELADFGEFFPDQLLFSGRF